MTGVENTKIVSIRVVLENESLKIICGDSVSDFPPYYVNIRFLNEIKDNIYDRLKLTC